MVGQLTLDQHIGVRIPGGQPNPLGHDPRSRRLFQPLTRIRRYSRTVLLLCSTLLVRSECY